MGAVFLNSVWPAVKNDDKSALAAYMQATKGTRSFLSLLHEGNHMKYVTKGRTLQRKTGAGVLSGAK
jgi:hypothetical protein